jgi:D-aminoacyl-tRNA deacylase
VRAVLQRVSRARVVVAGEVVGEIGHGLCVLLGVARGDERDTAARLAARVASLRVFENAAGRFDLSLRDVRGAALVVSQFTLVADTSKGHRPSFSAAAPPEEAGPVYEQFCDALRELGVPVQKGVFGTRMQVSLINDGPVTIVLDVDPPRTGRSP